MALRTQLSIAFVALTLSIAACAQGAGERRFGHDPNHDGAVGAGVALAPQILVDQFGYRPKDSKVAVIRSPEAGFDKDVKFEPGKEYEVRRAEDGRAVFKGSPTAWNGGAVEASSGDKGWWFDFSKVDAPDRYYVYDVQKKVRSPTFSIHANVYKGVLKAAMRTYFYQRSGMAKRSPYAEACWNDAESYAAANQDTQAHDITDRDNASKVRDLSGGWFDAGDTNKYVTYAAQPVHQLLTAYQLYPNGFTDDFNIPESGNGIPDLIDEVKWEIDWLKKMQYSDGGAALKVGVIDNGNSSPPSADKSPRFYIPECTSATIAVAGMFAHASLVFAQFPALGAYAEDLKSRAQNAWKNYSTAPAQQTSCDKGVVHAGNADWTAAAQTAYATEAAIYLFALTRDADYQNFIKAHYRETRPYHDSGWSRYESDQGESLLFYTGIPAADADLRKQILADKQADAGGSDHIYRFDPKDDLYRAYLTDGQYHWGSNNPRANYGVSNLDMIAYSLAGKDLDSYSKRGLEIVHYFHGVNPFGMAYLSNMYSLGASSSVNEIFHTWYREKTKWSDAKTSECGPPPGYVPGGPNASATKDGVPATISPPSGQPAQKSYRDWNGIWPDASWVVTEPAIYYQSAYVRLLSAFVD